MLPPLPRCSRWAYSSLKITHPCQPSPVPRPGRPAHRPFRGLLSVHSRCGLHTRTVTVCRDRYPKASDTSSPPCLLRSLPAGAVAGWGLHPPEKRRLVTAHVERRHSHQILLKLSDCFGKVAPRCGILNFCTSRSTANGDAGHVASYGRLEGDEVLAWFSSWHTCPVDTHEA